MSDRTPPRPARAGDTQSVRVLSPFDISNPTPESAWGGATGAGVSIAIIDSGIEASHPAVGGRVDETASVAVTIVDGEPVLEHGPHRDVYGHGTACAGIIHELAPDARLVSVRVLGERLTGKSNQFLAGLEWAVEQGFDVINLSLGTKKREWALPFHDVCDRAYFGGSIVVTAANNILVDSYPSTYASVVSVACNSATDRWRFHYNPAPPTEFLARGIDVDVAWVGGGRQQVTGNSFAAPHIAGLAALIKSKHPELRPFQLKAVLYATAANILEADGRAGRLTSTMAQLPVERRTGR